MSLIKIKLEKRVNSGAGRIIWAFDPKLSENDPFTKFITTFDEIKDIIAGIKINRQFILPHGLQHPRIKEIIDLVSVKNEIPLIMDAKVNDIGYTNESIASLYFNAGFDALIVNPFVGKDGIRPVVEISKDLHKDVIFLVYMSHQTASFGYGRKVLLTEEEKSILKQESAYLYELFAHSVNNYKISGAIVGGTHPKKIQEVRKILSNEKLIFSPGIGAQGGELREARKQGMDYTIIGRSITENRNRVNYCKKIKELLR